MRIHEMILGCLICASLLFADSVTLNLTLDTSIQRLLENNLIIRAAQFEAAMADSSYQKYQQKFTPFVGVEGSESKQKLPETSLMAKLMGDEEYQNEFNAYVGSYFQTGTTAIIGVKNTFTDNNGEAMILPIGSGIVLKEAEYPHYMPVAYVKLQQELLKNSFGYADRRQNDMLDNVARMKRDALSYQISGLVVSGIVDYWTVAVKKTALDNARLELESNTSIRESIKEDVTLGQIESFNLNQFNALVAASEVKVMLAEQAYKESVRHLLRTLDVTADVQNLEVTRLQTELPNYATEALVSMAYQQRADYQNALKALENAGLQTELYTNALLPSLTASLTYAQLGQEARFADAYKDTTSGKYHDWQAKLQMTMPLENKLEKTNLRDAEYQKKQAVLTVARLRQEIRDDVLNKTERVQMLHAVTQKAQIARAEAEAYYAKMVKRIHQGNFNSAALKNAVDGMVQSRQQELEAQVQYNVALLQLDLATNSFLKNHHIALDTYIQNGVAHE